MLRPCTSPAAFLSQDPALTPDGCAALEADHNARYHAAGKRRASATELAPRLRRHDTENLQAHFPRRALADVTCDLLGNLVGAPVESFEAVVIEEGAMAEAERIKPTYAAATSSGHPGKEGEQERQPS